MLVNGSGVLAGIRIATTLAAPPQAVPARSRPLDHVKRTSRTRASGRLRCVSHKHSKHTRAMTESEEVT